jgi:hypothetical protein
LERDPLILTDARLLRERKTRWRVWKLKTFKWLIWECLFCLFTVSVLLNGIRRGVWDLAIFMFVLSWCVVLTFNF